jgi:hypothetical protein
MTSYRFIRNHFADSFRMLSDAAPNIGSREEKWISSNTLLEAAEITPPRPPKTPEPTGVPTFVFSTPGGRSPQSMKTSSSPGSPLTPMQFMRRADRDAVGVRPSTPTKAGPIRQRHPLVNTPKSLGQPVWKP